MKTVKLGDLVSFRFQDGSSLDGYVEVIPLSTLDDWVVRETQHGKTFDLVYVRNYSFARITSVNKETA